MSRFSLSFKFGLLFLGFILAVGVLVGLFVDAGRRVAVNMFDLKDRAFPEYEDLAAAHDELARAGNRAVVGPEQRLPADLHGEPERGDVVPTGPGLADAVDVYQIRGEGGLGGKAGDEGQREEGADECLHNFERFVFFSGHPFGTCVVPKPADIPF